MTSNLCFRKVEGSKTDVMTRNLWKVQRSKTDVMTSYLCYRKVQGCKTAGMTSNLC